jgi:uncharacterized membrane protein
MWNCADLKQKARLSLTGKYWWAVLWTLVFSLLTSMATSVVSFISCILFQIVGLFGTTFIGLKMDSDTTNTWMTSGVPSSFYYGVGIYILAMSAVFLFLYAMTFAVSIFVVSPLSLGYQKWFFDIRAGGDGKKMDSFFMAFRKNNYGRMVKGMAWKMLWTFLWALIAMIPILISMIVAFVFVIPRSYNLAHGIYTMRDSEIIAWVILGIVYTAGFIFYIVILLNKYLSYQFVPYLLLDDSSLGYREALKKSMAMSKGQILHMLGLDVSFIGWWLLVMLTCGYGALFLAPYPIATRTELYFARKAEMGE